MFVFTQVCFPTFQQTAVPPATTGGNWLVLLPPAPPPHQLALFFFFKRAFWWAEERVGGVIVPAAVPRAPDVITPIVLLNELAFSGGELGNDFAFAGARVPLCASAVIIAVGGYRAGKQVSPGTLHSDPRRIHGL